MILPYDQTPIREMPDRHHIRLLLTTPLAIPEFNSNKNADHGKCDLPHTSTERDPANDGGGSIGIFDYYV
jgi:hypothetical protein